MSQDQPSAADVARRAGVSRTQVSYVLNNRRMDHVSEENRQKILRAAEELRYYPQQSGQALRRGFANHFALFFPAPYTFRINAMLGVIHEKGLADGCVPVQYSFNSYGDPVRKTTALRALVATKPRGLFCSLFDVDDADLAEAAERGVKNIVVFDVNPHPVYPTLCVPLEEVGFLAVRHLMERGHRRIGILRPSDQVAQRGFLPRWEGARRATAGVSGVELVELLWPQDEARPTLEGAQRFLDDHQFLASGVTALYAYGDEFALPLLAICQERGISVPGAVAILGTDDLPYGTMVQPKLSTIRFDQGTLGARAVTLINGAITGHSAEQDTSRPLVPVLVVRQST